MADYTLDWDVTGADGAGTFSSGSGGPDVGVTVSTPSNGDGDSFFLSSGLLKSDYVREPAKTIVTFDSAVENVTFDLFDVDANDSWDDKITIIARDADGNIVPVSFSGSTIGTLQTVNGNSIEGTDNGDNDGSGPGDNDTVSVSISDAVVSIEIIHDHGNSDDNSGLISVGDISFDLSPVGDGIVEGTSGDDTIDLAYMGDPEGDMIDNDDALLPGEVGDDDIVDAGAGDDSIFAEEGDDEIYAGHDDDYVEAGAGDDIIYGDSDLPGGSDATGARESFEWDLAPDPNGPAPIEDGDPINGFTQDTGSVDVTFSLQGAAFAPQSEFADNNQKVDGIDTGDETIDNQSSLASRLDQEGECQVYRWDFSSEVTDVQFRINDIDYDSEVVITAYDAHGNKIPIHTNTGGDIAASNLDGIAGNEHLRSDIDGGSSDTTGSISALVTIAGPVARIEVLHNQDGDDNSGINITDIYFDAPGAVIGDEDGNDTLLGEDGADIIYGEGGDDILDGGLDDGDADQLFGGDDADTIQGVGVGDFVDGGAGGNDHDTLDLTGSTEQGGSLKVNITGPDSDGNGFDGTVTYFDNNGVETGTLTFENIEEIVPCFTPGTLIATPKGERLVEELREGDKIITRDNGIQEIRWAGHKALSGRELLTEKHLRPVLIRAGSLGNGLPERDMLVSPNHRMLVANDRTALYFEEREVLVAAKHLVNNRGVNTMDTVGTTYIHFMFDQHEVVLANGAWTESFQPGDYSLQGLGNAQRNEIFELFPELESVEGRQDYQAARKVLKKHEASLLSL
ncbi:hypothetical protein ACMU_07840 [Actibacterium mucosum KCTC 23349]|uniref:Hint domain-containing protein n=2 Tax=Actibacterium TaxID=1433986 RepID=A0A037ZK88_9RHOB|nr:hypothetical protein ACMU_07840 [Actibacterium mucosum KCTC 23349]